MEGESNSTSQNQAQYLETELTNKLQEVVVEMSEVNEQCIYKVPQKFRHGNPKAYTPQVVSIGPFHRQSDSNEGNNNLKKMEELKLEYLQRFLDRNKQITMKDLFQKLIEKEKQIRSCYAEPINWNSNDFLTMIIVDACFIIEHFLRFYTGLDSIERDLFSEIWLVNNVLHDLILLENQLPFFVLEDIFNSVRPGMKVEFPKRNDEFVHEFNRLIRDVDSLSFLGITVRYFRKYNCMKMNENTIESPKHFTDLLRTFMQPSKIRHESLKVGYMVKIIANWMGDAGAVTKMFNNLCSNVIVSYISDEYCSLYDDLIKFHENPRNKYKAIFYNEYFNTPWKKASTTAAVLLLLLTLIQAICSVISVF